MSDDIMPAWDICIDVSDAQGAVDWLRVRQAGIRIAFIKASEGDSFVARSWPRNRVAAAAAGIAVVPYHFLRPVNTIAAMQAQAKHFSDTAQLEEGMACALDWEGRAATTCTAAYAQLTGELLAQVTNRRPIGYWGLPGASPADPTEAMLRWPRWIPRYPQRDCAAWSALPAAIRQRPTLYWYKPGGEALPEFAQYTATGRVAGITGFVDRSVACFGSAALAIDFITGATSPAVAQQGAEGTGAATPVAAVAAAAVRPPSAPWDDAAGSGDSADELNQAELDNLTQPPSG